MHLAKQGYLVFAGVRKEEYAQPLRDLGQGMLIPICPLDVRSPAHIAAAKQIMEQELLRRGIPGLYAIISNAGGGFIAPIELMDMEKMKAEVDTRIMGPIALLQAMLPLIRAGGGRLIWIQTPGLMPIAFDTSIHACDFASNCLARTLRQELKPWNIPSVQIRCGGIRTPSVQHSYDELNENLHKWSAAGPCLYADALRKTERGFKEFDRRRSGPELVAKTVEKALCAKQPRRRYQIGYMSKIFAFMECLPQPLTDWMMERR